MFSYISPEQRMPPGHPSRGTRRLIYEALRRLSPQFSILNARIGRPSIAPEKLLCALLLPLLCLVRSKRQGR